MRASKENARKALGILERIAKGEGTTQDLAFMQDFLSKVIGRLPTEATIAKGYEVRATKNREDRLAKRQARSPEMKE